MAEKKINRYEIQRELGRGGMATVYLAYDPRFEREVALKSLPRYFAHEEDFQARFQREARILARLEHYAIVPVYDYGEDESPYLVMRYMRGGTLKNRLQKGPQTLSETLQILERIGDALDKAHEKGIIHRDLKPDNILFDDDNRAYLSDFGIVKLAESSQAFTKTGGILGTPAYMSPEQASGSREIDGRSDIYALGVILYEMLTGKAPYHADTPVGLILAHVNEPVPQILEANPNLPPGCEDVIQRAMAKNPDHRYSSALEMVAALRAIEAGNSTTITTAPAAAGSEKTVVDEAPGATVAGATWQGGSSTMATPTAAGGTQVSSVAQGGPPPPPPGQSTSAESGSGRPFNPWLLAGIAVIALALLGFGAVALLGGNGDDSGTNGGNDDDVIAAAIDATRTVEAAQAEATARMEGAVAATLDYQATLAAEAEAQQQATAAAGETATGQAIVAATASAVPTETPTPTLTPSPTPAGGGARIGFDSDRDGQRELYVMNNDGSQQTRLTVNPATDADPEWSPDGTLIVFNSDRDGFPDGNPEVYVMSEDGRFEARLTESESRDWATVWSPDGSKIAFASDRDGEFEIYVMNADGSDLVQLTNNDIIDTFPSFSPDGTQIVFERVMSQANGAPRNIVVISLDGSYEQQLTEDGSINQYPSWSPDGTRIAFTSNRTGDREIFVMNVDGSNPVQLTDAPGLDTHPVWSPDGTRIAFGSRRDDNYEVYVMNADGSDQRNLSNNPAAEDVFPFWIP